ncbi:alpha-E domain-containing protein [Histidinibacterium aquaticum]|uniref:Alpha-E domain-containing protein n=1 Tax=Histidinibacterium aquaticum TaxID=2613962 RepID=A0A5J5GL90_9RHOB|nr:alpha-E domain-containing protein [Histidinibacterium aquaticum]KAA9008242.1 alpha-E domain-containing protein [Histidinibacterium aquaticum]
MLGKTANGLYWLSRSLERAENTARLADAGQRIALTRLSGADDEWGSILQAAGGWDGYMAGHGEVTRDDAIDWMLRSPDNPSSVLSSIKSARQNARMVRTALTEEMWEAMNGCYMAVRDALARKVGERDLPECLQLIRSRTALVRGATHGTMLRNDIYDFLRIGTFLERADSTARILDVKYYILLPAAAAVGSDLDNVQWESILESVSARGGYRMVHGSRVRPQEIVQFLILDKRMPRSLNFCCSKIHENLRYLVNDYGQQTESADMAERLASSVRAQEVDDIFDYGLHEYIQSFLGSIADVGRQVEVDYRFYE